LDCAASMTRSPPSRGWPDRQAMLRQSVRNMARPRSVWLRSRELDHPAPLLGFVGDELPEFGRRACKYRRTEVSESCFHLGIGESAIDLPVEVVHDLGGRVLRRSNCIP